MKLILFITVLCLVSISCKNIIGITKNEDSGIKEVLDFYGGYCEYSIGASVSTDEGTKKYFELKISKSEALDRFSASPDFPASNVAYLFYKNLKQEKNNLTEIHSVLLFDKRDKFEAIYSLDKLKLITSKLNVLNKVVDLIKAKNFDGLKPLLSDGSYSDSSKNALAVNLQKIDATFGNIKEFRIFGFRFETLNGFNVLNIIGVMIRDKQNNEFSLKVDLKPSEDKVHFLDYKFE